MVSVETQFNFISGLPRSGTTLLAAILRQNPKIETNMSSPIASIFSAVQKTLSKGNEAELFLTETQKEKILKSIFTSYYEGIPIAFDSSRSWTTKLPILTKLFPSMKMICCVRNVGWIMDSLERLTRKNPTSLSGIFGYDPNSTVYDRVAALGAGRGMVGYALNSLKEAFYGEHSDRLLLIEYQALCANPSKTMSLVYEWLNLEPFKHDFNNLKTPPLAEEFDKQLGTEGLHKIKRKIKFETRDTILPPELFNYPPSFWRTANPKNVPVILFDKEN